ncbi:3-carboxy-cis,cis-muconate cycloisomerase [Poseidonocella sedimentorum]|uniref:3-carboxy-cis,cis-muconate cycloisomerase n=1 Tax=Poseidonocella sedimentorum TaxID=871652 RepID=A0A1I6E0Y7_9RHOB|nr:3-carboxy-cis,cis-muconate cycloisomerase [Poseidonocella sedimentorum]SFR11221.1 3-carboxy-cis,cis-muconate cycloisomerase [Poseidonocella sedimentorum]
MSGFAGDPLLSALFGDAEIAGLTGSDAWAARMIEVEAGYAAALGRAGRVHPDLGDEAADAIRAVRPDLSALALGMARDGVAVPALVRQIKAALPERLHDAVHTGLTSQDVMDSAFALCLKAALPVFRGRIEAVQQALEALAAQFGDHPLMARTRMQAALPVTVAHRIEAWRRPFEDHLARLDALELRLLRLQFGGPVGARYLDQAEQINAALAAALGLSPVPSAWHSDRSALAELGGWLSLVSGSLGKIGQDIALMAQQGLDEIRLAGGGGSSAMAHKQNPVGAEVLVTLARANAARLGGLHQALVHEQERSGAAWSLEWMLLPQMLESTGRGLSLAFELLGQVERMGSPDET